LYPEILLTINSQLSLFIPDPAHLRRVYETAREQDADTPFPYWAQVWPSAKALSNFITEQPQWVIGKNVLELGAGIGLPSFIAANYAQQVLVSDYAPEAGALLEKNIQRLGFTHVQADCINWNHFPADIRSDVVLLSDVNYAPEEFPGLLTCLQQLLQNGSTLLLSSPQRIMAAPFAAALEPYVQQSFERKVQHGDAFVTISIWVLSFSAL
jgi:predicted nicotinamide N-methyase